ncbi:DUF2063 domain-containing protein [Pseudoruegeria sp. SK021]|uniref:HvfC/BufC N-terminal domain-containing protein n=1 Tax=Pseudoruegeria sp. SK021 TaxID=1933035 RepID=UPI000A25449D|nr:DNA-binding domain-containing protein [Pseudoruegeria sp. SK021]OSP54249.1 DUF2063 domain-containing protein [Pseudoruegeria sp. SK021]
MTGQSEFVAALLDPAAAVPAGLTGPDGRPAGKRFDVYRNNVVVSLTEALETGFPVVRKLVGDAFFQAMAGLFLRQHPPQSPVLALYGAEFPEFLAQFPPAQHLAYLADVARLELDLRRAYHAADAPPLDPACLQDLSQDALMATRFTFAPAVTLRTSPYPIHAIWQRNMTPGAPVPTPGAQTVLISRPEFDPMLDLLDPAQSAFIQSLKNAATFGVALAAATDADPLFDLTPALGLLLARGALTSLTKGPS